MPDFLSWMQIGRKQTMLTGRPAPQNFKKLQHIVTIINYHMNTGLLHNCHSVCYLHKNVLS